MCVCICCSISYNNLTNKGLSEMTPGLITCKRLEILGYSCVLIFYILASLILVLLFIRLRGTGLDEGAGDNLAQILMELPSLTLLE